MPDILVPFAPEHVFYGIVAGSFAWGVIAGSVATWWLTTHRLYRVQRQALKERLGSAH